MSLGQEKSPDREQWGGSTVLGRGRNLLCASYPDGLSGGEML